MVTKARVCKLCGAKSNERSPLLPTLSAETLDLFEEADDFIPWNSYDINKQQMTKDPLKSV